MLQLTLKQGNRLANLPPHVSFLTSLTSLELARNQLTELPPHLCKLYRLKFLSAWANEIETVRSLVFGSPQP